MRSRFPHLAPALIAGLTASLLLAGTVMAAPMTFTADLANAGEGAEGGSGSAEITIDADTGEVCWELSVSGIGDVVASHIHVGAEGEDGGVVVPLDTDGFTDSSSGCITPEDADLDAIVSSPAGYYVNIHTADFPGGAIRGQLAATGETPDTALGAPQGPNLVLIGLILLAAAGIGGARFASVQRRS